MTVANTDMAAAWDGIEGARWARHAHRYESTSRRIWHRFLDRGPIREGDDVVDVGCGTGKSTLDAARLARTGSVLGVDLSSQMLDHARKRAAAEGVSNVRFEQADAQVHPFPEAAFDVAISSFGAMFFGDPVAAFANVGRALRPGGRLALLSWQDLRRNEWLTVLRDALALDRSLPEPPVSVPGPFGLADPDYVRRVLGAAGFDDVGLEGIEEHVEIGTDAGDAFSFVRTMGIVEGLTQELDESSKARALEQVRAVLATHETSDGVLLKASAWLITARRVEEAHDRMG